jgi:hypothetical protein
VGSLIFPKPASLLSSPKTHYHLHLALLLGILIQEYSFNSKAS